MEKQTKNWMERLANNYRIPTDGDGVLAKAPKKILSESQLKKVLNRDK